MRRWTARYTFAWTPIVTFGLKRLKFLEWIDQNLEPTAFSEGPDHVGVAPKRSDVRLTVRHNRMTVDDGAATDSGVSALLPLVGAVFESFQPKSVVLSSASAAWTAEWPDPDYDAARRRFAIYQTGGPITAALRPSDSSTLIDLSGPDHEGQAEFGIVSREELKERLTNPDVGRMVGRPETKLRHVKDEEFPAVSLFVDLSLRTTHPELLEDQADVETELSDVNSLGEQFVTVMAEQIQSRQEEAHDVR
ncbi:hypothetical protein [Amnibacterium kyonggiense]|uniref:TIGR04255 family protein n=1 Tax=Amnibacterium kyonggiense TaxID=595671 RepID=A0A4R7FP54_9MICO|nr:hypothetical protein [Amnibacterium kyonggiense]TDS79515.1 hypothetical protein CLV52_0044 [Amnibacterium kyonggiense]